MVTEATINQHIAYITPSSSRVTSDYLQLYLVAAYAELRSISSASGSTKGALTCENIKHFKIVLPPVVEQDRLVSVIRQETADIESTVSYTQREIDLIREYRTRLIADVVTGKLDVRGVDLAAYGDEIAGLDEALADEGDAGDEELALASEAEE